MIQLSELCAGYPGITPCFGNSLAEAGSVSLHSHNHPQSTPLKIQGSITAEETIWWDPPNQQTLNCWNDPDEATEFGATGIAILLVKKYHKYKVIQRSRKGTGFDYWLGKSNHINFKDKARLEVSGINKGSDNEIRRRVELKLNQIDQSKGLMLPGLVVVVEFSNPLADMREK
jgi:hypothetical protein